MSSPTEKALSLIKYLPRVSLDNLVRNPYAKRHKQKNKGQYRKLELINKSNRERRRFWPVGYEGGRSPFYLKIPIENYYRDFNHRRQYPPLSLSQLQLLINQGLVNEDEPIDLASLCNAQLYQIDPKSNHYGVNLTDEGSALFTSRINIEVQHTSEQVIAAIERNGGSITTAYFDIKSVIALHKPLIFFKKGEVIPKRELPTEDAFEYYSNPKNRGYLADPQLIEEEKIALAQKYGYELPKKDANPLFNIRKDPRQIFFGLEPGWLVNLKDKEILRPTNKDYVDYYKS